MARRPAPVLRGGGGAVRPGVPGRHLPGSCAVTRGRRRRSLHRDEHRRRPDTGAGRRPARSRRRSSRLLRSRAVSRRFRPAGERAATGGVDALGSASVVASGTGRADASAAAPVAPAARSSLRLIRFRRRWTEGPSQSGEVARTGPAGSRVFSTARPMCSRSSRPGRDRRHREAADRTSCPDPRVDDDAEGTHDAVALSRHLCRRCATLLLSSCSHAMAARQPDSGRRSAMPCAGDRLDRGQGGVARLCHCPARKGK